MFVLQIKCEWKFLRDVLWFFLKLMLIKDYILEVRLPQADKKESNQRIDEEIQIEENI